ncbi:uncharacterized protein LOC105195738 [Solenopsis invicta]|uniref:uncharacterized protein LOC105195738 n=1 Tax=Solenopsis invicta TaxID=13686 RepID=UPI0001FE815C|nr:uncharacterized protein LOC105195738 [Solenopsis invicta]
MKGNNSKDTTMSPRKELRHDMITFLSTKKDKLLSYQFKFPITPINQCPRKNKFQFQYRSKSWLCDTSNAVSWLSSPNSSSDYISFDTYKSMPSRSAKIMRALSSTCSSFRNESTGIRKSLNFDSTPSPKRNSSYDGSSTSSINADTPSSILNSSSTDSIDSNVPIASVESIDENQNRTPQQNRKRVNKSNDRTDRKDNIRSRTSYLMSLLEKGLDEGINRLSNRVITTSTPRNLAQEFNQEIGHDRPHTPENMIDVIPESISAIKKSHKKDKWYSHEEQSSIQRMDVSLQDDNSNSKIKKTDIIAKASCSTAAENESQKKNRNIKRTLIYNDERPDVILDFNHSIQQKIMTEYDLLPSGLDKTETEMQEIDSNDCESLEESMQVDDLINNDKDLSKESICDKETRELSLQKDSGICNVSMINERMEQAPECNSSTSQDANKVVTPENHVNMLKHVLTESIKKSHKKMKHTNRKTLFKMKDLQKMEKEMELTESEISIEDACHDTQDINNQTADIIHLSSPENLEFDRPGTPENVSSSRLLVLDFNSVKKSHKKDKRSKKTSSFVEHCNYEYRKRNSRYGEENIDEILYRDKFLGLKDSSDMLPKKKKKSISTSLHSSTPKVPSDFKLLGCKNLDEEFKIHTPIKKPPILLTVTSHDEISQEENKLAQATSKEIDCSRCVTPVGRFKELRKKDPSSERDNVKKLETNTSVSKVVDTPNRKDENGRSTPINMSTTELLCNVNSIKKSHKKDKHDRNKKPISKKKRSYVEENRHSKFANSEIMLEECSLPLMHHNYRAEKEICIIMRDKEKNESYKEIAYDDPQPSTSRGDNIESAKKTTKSKYLNTPPNSSDAVNLRKLLYTTSIKKSHKKERNMNAQTKYIFMSQDPELSDDGSIFDEADRLNFIENEISTM